MEQLSIGEYKRIVESVKREQRDARLAEQRARARQ